MVYNKEKLSNEMPANEENITKTIVSLKPDLIVFNAFPPLFYLRESWTKNI